jgi:hypothetical protein
VALFYGSQKDAFLALLKLQQIEQDRGLQSVGILDASVYSEASRGRLRVDRTIEFREANEQRLSEIMTATVLNRRAIGHDDQIVSEHFSALGFEVNLLRQVGENLPQDGAALVMLLREAWYAELSELISRDVYVERWAPNVVGVETFGSAGC